MAELWDCFFGDLASFIRLCGARENGATTAVAESTLLKLENYIQIIRTIMYALNREEFRAGVCLFVLYCTAQVTGAGNMSCSSLESWVTQNNTAVLQRRYGTPT